MLNDKNDSGNEKLNVWRGLVRPITIHLVLFAYVVITCYVIYLLMWKGKYDNALALWNGFSGVVSAIIGFWFGTRKVSKPASSAPPHSRAQEAGTYEVFKLDPEKLRGLLKKRNINLNDLAKKLNLLPLELIEKINNHTKFSPEKLKTELGLS